ncbi:MAG TPA: hypothetical protein VNI55_05895 [Gaiellaceae bacterium]|nr:hypothetical protein [Gaiellaceae bacterium]
MVVEELAPGLWRWSARRDDAEVWCLYVETDAATVLIDPVLPDEPERFFRALDRDLERRGKPLTILCTSAEHEREAAPLVERYEATLLRA